MSTLTGVVAGPKQNIIDVSANFFLKKPKEVSKLVEQTLKWFDEAGLIDPKADAVVALRKTAVVTKLVTGGPCEIPDVVREIGEKTVTLAKDPSWKSVKDTFWALNKLPSPVADTLELGIVPIAHETFRMAKGISGASLVLGMGKDILAAADKIADAGLESAKTDDEQKLAMDTITANMIKLAKSVSYFVLGLLIVSSIFLNAVAPGLAFLSAATSALVFTILGYFNDELGQPAFKRVDLTK